MLLGFCNSGCSSTLGKVYASENDGLAQLLALLPVLFSSTNCGFHMYEDVMIMNIFVQYQIIIMISSIRNLLPHNICFIYCQVCQNTPSHQPYLIFVADATDNVRVKNFVRCKHFQIERKRCTLHFPRGLIRYFLGVFPGVKVEIKFC